MKKLLSLVLAVVMLLACANLASASSQLAGTYDVTVWVAEKVVDLTRQQIDAFNANNAFGIIINATVENQPAVLSRIVGLFSGRGYNIETLNVGPCADPRFSRMTITVPGDEHVLEQVLKQLNKLVDVVKVVDLTEEKHIERELVLVEVGAPKQKRPEVLEIADVFHAEIVGVRETTVTMQFVGREDEVEDFLRLLRPYTIVNLARSGLLAVMKGD
jgi:acetolactate synthase-1/3 small subunit